jgi:hypothetical protein
VNRRGIGRRPPKWPAALALATVVIWIVLLALLF